MRNGQDEAKIINIILYFIPHTLKCRLVLDMNNLILFFRACDFDLTYDLIPPEVKRQKSDWTHFLSLSLSHTPPSYFSSLSSVICFDKPSGSPLHLTSI